MQRIMFKKNKCFIYIPNKEMCVHHMIVTNDQSLLMILVFDYLNEFNKPFCAWTVATGHTI